MPRLLARNKKGFAVFQHNENYIFVKPPYNVLMKVTRLAADLGVQFLGYSPCDQRFEDIDSLVEYLTTSSL